MSTMIPITGAIVGQAIADHPLVRKVGFTGSTPIGKTIMESCAKSNLKKVSLELGGKSPLIIFSDCDMDRAVRYVSGIDTQVMRYTWLINPVSNYPVLLSAHKLIPNWSKYQICCANLFNNPVNSLIIIFLGTKLCRLVRIDNI